MNDKQHAQMISDIELNRVKTLAPRFNDVEIGGRRINVIADQSNYDNDATCDE
jgi:hypothetical protein